MTDKQITRVKKKSYSSEPMLGFHNKPKQDHISDSYNPQPALEIANQPPKKPITQPEKNAK